MSRFYTDGTTINGYHAIYDEYSEDGTIWIDCKKTYLKIITDALNKELEGVKPFKINIRPKTGRANVVYEEIVKVSQN